MMSQLVRFFLRRIRCIRLFLLLLVVCGVQFVNAFDRYIQLTGSNGKVIDAEVLDVPSTGVLQLRTREGKLIKVKVCNISTPSNEELANYIGGIGFSRFRGINGYKKDWKRARNLLRCAYEMGDPNSSYVYGLIESEYGSKTTAFYAFRDAVKLGHRDAKNALGECFYYGDGCRKDYGKALKWFIAAAGEGNAWACFNAAQILIKAGKDSLFVEYLVRGAVRFAEQGNRDGLALSAQLAEDSNYPQLAARILAMEVKDPTLPRESGGGISTGTAWFFSPTELVTCHHVIANGARMTLRIPGEKTEVPLEVVAISPEYDLAILRVKSSSTFKTEAVLPISTKKPRLGESIFVLGYPLTYFQGQNIKYTDGTISALSGYEDTDTRIQHSAPTQPGNSGGPLLNKKGEVVGVVDSGLDKTLASNVNYAVKTPLLVQLLKQHNLAFQDKTTLKDDEEVIAFCQKAVYLIVAYPAED